MPIKHAIWKVGVQPSPLTTATLVNEQQFKDMIVATPQIISSEWRVRASQAR